MDKDVQRDDEAKVENQHSNGRVFTPGRASGGSAARSLASPELKGIDAAQAGRGNGSSKERIAGSTIPNAANDKRRVQGIATDIDPDGEGPARSTKAPVVFRQVTVETQSPATVSRNESGSTGLFEGTDGKETAEGAEDNLEATRLLKPEQLARAFSTPPRGRVDADAALTQVAKPQPNSASSGETDWPQFRGSMPRIARDDESTQYFQLSIPKSGPIRAESARNGGQTDESSDPAAPRPVSRSTDRPQTAMISSPSTESSAQEDQGAPSAVRENAPSSHPAPQPAQGGLQALVPGLLVLNLLLTLLSLAANACLAFHFLTAGR
jgi:hypothetical protein